MCAYYGVTGWFFEVDDFATEEQRLYSVSPAAVKVLQTNFAFQTWDFAVSFLHKELNAPEMLAHHSLAALFCIWRTKIMEYQGFTKASVQKYYQNIWYLFYGEYLILPFL